MFISLTGWDGQPPGTETLKLLVSEAPQPFGDLESSGIRPPTAAVGSPFSDTRQGVATPTSPLHQMLYSARYGRRSAATGPARNALWTAHDVELEILMER